MSSNRSNITAKLGFSVGPVPVAGMAVHQGDRIVSRPTWKSSWWPCVPP